MRATALRSLGAVVIALTLLAAAQSRRPAAAQPPNLLTNPGFEAGYHRQDSIPELGVPNEWRLHYLDGQSFPGVPAGYVAYRPESVVWYIQDAPVEERSLFFLDGNYTLKVFKPWAPLYAALSQDVGGLQPGAVYEWNANVFVDVIDHYDSSGKKVPPSNEPEAVMLRLGVSSWGATWRDESRISYTPWWTAGNTRPFHQTYLALRQLFTASSSRVTVWVEMASKFAYVNNGFFMDAFSLRLVNPPTPDAASSTPTAAGPTPTPTTQAASPTPTATPISATASPTATVVVTPTATPTSAFTAAPTTASSPTPAASATPGYTLYTIRSGDTLYRIASRYGLTTAELAAYNGITNTWRIYAGQAIKIPAATGSVAAPASQVAPTAASSQRTYVVRPGDTLFRIALNHGLTTAQLAAANAIADPRKIYAGQVLVIP
ncbi:MAG: LysM peptidoglycan-binding domain-containing protein [Chloroflexi bacterium]|nr:LysM peptidoglycan-binding domain-containing protein [Chloroflexota bacterium]